VSRVSQLNRSKIRTRFEQRFTARRMALDYLKTYRSIMNVEQPHLRLVQ
jgi:hypothetical protein